MEISVPERGIRVSAVAAKALWQTVENYKLPFGEEYVQYKLKWQRAYCNLALSEYRRFAFLALISDSEITPSEAIDEVWHLHILHTQDYSQFGAACQHFLHHWPGMPTNRPQFNKQYEMTREMYRVVFGYDAPQAFWPLQKTSFDVSRPRISKVLEVYRGRPQSPTINM